MGKTTKKIMGLSRDTNAMPANDETGVLGFIINAMLLLKQVFGLLLASFVVGAQAGNILICLLVIFMGPAFIIGLLAR